MTYVNGQYVMYGGLDSSKKSGKVGPTDELFVFRIGKGKIFSLTETDSLNWSKEKCGGDQPPARTHHAACGMGKDKLFIFGGH